MSAFTDLLKTLAPTVAAALGGPLAGMAVSAIGSAFGLDSPTKEKIEEAFSAGRMMPEQVAALKTLELQFQNDERERGFKYAELEFKDRDSARQMQIATKSYTPEILSWMIILATLSLEGYILLEGIPPMVSDLVAGRILGTLDTAFGTVLAFWLGTSYGSRAKDAIIARGAGN